MRLKLTFATPAHVEPMAGVGAERVATLASALRTLLVSVWSVGTGWQGLTCTLHRGSQCTCGVRVSCEFQEA